MTKKKSAVDTDDQTAGDQSVTLHGLSCHVFEEFTLDEIDYVHFCSAGGDPRVLRRDQFDDVTEWVHPVSKEKSKAEDPAGLDTNREAVS